MELRGRVVVGWVGGVALGTLASAALNPAWLTGVARKEGPVEWVSELLLAAAVVAWCARSRRARPRPVALGIAFACAVVLAEELDWGRGLQIPHAAAWLESVVGKPNLHNAAGGSSYLLFALPWIGLYVAAAKGWGAAAGVPPRMDAAAAFAIACAAAASVVLPVSMEAVVDEVTELALYGLVLLGAWRGAGSGARHNARRSGGEQLEGDQAAGAAGALPGAVDRADAGLA